MRVSALESGLQDPAGSGPEIGMTRTNRLLTVFISELSCRAWLVAETNKRRTLQKADVANAIAHSDMFDFLIDIIPRDDGSGGGGNGGKGQAAGGSTGTSVNGGEIHDGVGGGVDAVNGGEVETVVHDPEQDERDEEDRVFTEFMRDDED